MKKSEQNSISVTYDQAQRMLLDGKVDFVQGARLLFSFGYAFLQSGELLKAERVFSDTTTFIDEVRKASGLPYHTDFARAAFHHGVIMLEISSQGMPIAESILNQAIKSFEESAAILELRMQESVTLSIPHALGTALFFLGIAELRLYSATRSAGGQVLALKATVQLQRAAELWKQIALSGFHPEQALQGALTSITALTLAQEGLLASISARENVLSAA